MSKCHLVRIHILCLLLQLKKLGFKHIDALDPAEGMLQRAKEKNIYERYICDYITDKPLDIEPGMY